MTSTALPSEHARVLERSSSSRSRAPFVLGAICTASLACAPPAAEAPRPPTTASAAPAPPVNQGSARRRGRTLLADPPAAPLAFTLAPILGGRSALAIAQRADDRAAFARRIDGATGALGPVQRTVDRRVFGALDRPNGSLTLVTSDGARLCFDAACVESHASAIVPVGDRVALLEVVSKRPPEPASRVARPAPKPKDTKETRPAKAAKGTAKGAAKGAAKKRPARHGGGGRRPSHPLVEVLVRWVDASGSIDAEARPTGLHFEAPLDGMTLIDARARAPGIDVLWYETAPKRRSRASLGSGRMMAASLRADGSLDFASRVPVVDADLEYGNLKDHRAPRLAGDDAVSVVIGLDGKGQCEATRVRPSLAHLTPASPTCAVAPDRLALPSLDPAEIAAYARIFADEPRRTFGQPRGDLGLVAWAGDRGYWQRAGSLRSASRLEGTARDEAHPFPAKRSRLAWGAFATDGEGVAVVDGAVVHVDARGAIARAPIPPKNAALLAPEIPADRRRAARIGATFWIARGSRVRVWPEVSAPVSTPSHADTSVLVGGQDRGLAIDLVGAALSLSSLDASGSIAPLAALSPAPVRAGFDACERASGGAIVAGASAKDAGKIVTFTVDPSGRASAPRAVPLPSRAGDLAVRLTPLPAGGALLTDLARRHVVWLDDDARPLAGAPWPDAEVDAACPDGRAARASIPSPTFGQFTRIPDLGDGACVTGEMVWSRDGALRWFGGTAEGLDFHAESASLPLLPPLTPPASTPVTAPNSPPPPLKRACPPEMVSIAGRFCVDRFESSLYDARTGEALSPDYPATPGLLDFALAEWSTARERTGNAHARAFPLPWISPSRLGDKPEPLAVSRLGARPSGYVTGVVAEAACAAAGKRLCSLDEFITACRGEDNTLFPYGESYEDGICNVFREEHPAALLHNNASMGHLDPRLNRVSPKGRPLLQRTGESPGCRSRWGDDAIYDMVGNLDEWVEEGNGAFAGGFYARSTRSGCEALVTAHPKSYLDYSTGVRCCKGAE